MNTLKVTTDIFTFCFLLVISRLKPSDKALEASFEAGYGVHPNKESNFVRLVTLKQQEIVCIKYY